MDTESGAPPATGVTVWTYERLKGNASGYREPT